MYDGISRETLDKSIQRPKVYTLSYLCSPRCFARFKNGVARFCLYW